MNVVVVGLGKIGLPLAVTCADAGASVVGADVSAAVVDLVSCGIPPFPNEADLDGRLAASIESGRLTATTDVMGAVASAEVVVVVVPLVVDGERRPDFGALDAATRAVGEGVRPGTLVCYETTMPVGTTRGRLAPALAASSGLRVGFDLFVCHSPERVSSGRVFADLRRYPKLVGGVDVVSEQRGVAFYESVLSFDDRADLSRPNGVWGMGSSEAAELTKLAETTYRDVNIALVNEFATYAERVGVDIDAVVDAANSQPYSHLHRPGIAVGGHCIPVYPYFYLAGDPQARLPVAARAVNERMPAHAVEVLENLVGSLFGMSVVVLGAAYRGGVKETAFSGVFPLVDVLHDRGAEPLVHDPLFTPDELGAMGFVPYRLGDGADMIVLQADHPEYRELSASDFPGVVGVLDGRGVLTPARFPGVAFARLGAVRPPRADGP